MSIRNSQKQLILETGNRFIRAVSEFSRVL
jgi:hypothetical protein